MKDPTTQPQEGLEIRTYFVRHRNALLARADFGDLYVDYYLHLAQFGLRPDPDHDRLFKDALAALVLHCASRPWNEAVAWTINLQKPLLNIFVTGNNASLSVAGQVFCEGVRERDGNLFCADVVRGQGEAQRSLVNFEGSEVMRAVECFYAKSEQRVARFLRLSEEDVVLIVAQPDCDLEWLETLTDDSARTLDGEEELSLLERRRYRWECGCTQERIMRVLAAAHRGDGESLFGDEEAVRVSCPRCGGRHTITREAFEAYLAEAEKADL